jgi:hypothetical protein
MEPNISENNTEYVQNAEVDIRWIISIADIPLRFIATVPGEIEIVCQHAALFFTATPQSLQLCCLNQQTFSNSLSFPAIYSNLNTTGP